MCVKVDCDTLPLHRALTQSDVKLSETTKILQVFFTSTSREPSVNIKDLHAPTFAGTIPVKPRIRNP